MKVPRRPGMDVMQRGDTAPPKNRSDSDKSADGQRAPGGGLRKNTLEKVADDACSVRQNSSRGVGGYHAAMAKTRIIFQCRECGAVQGRWLGKCPDCGAWDSLEQSVEDKSAEKDAQRGIAAGIVEAWTDLTPGPDGKRAGEVVGPANAARSMAEIGPAQAVARQLSGIGELDRVLGGGLVAGSAILAGGEPGIGKSTLLLQAAWAWASRGNKVLYVSSEESAEQVKLRASRLGLRPRAPEEMSIAENMYVLAETNLARIVEQARRIGPLVLVIDSVQMIYKADIPASPGSITQLRRCCSDLVYLAKLSGMSVILVGHVTKDGVLAGPRLLEHLVDAVLYFEGDRYHSHRVVRSTKNRFGTTLEIGLFEMTGTGLKELPEGGNASVVQMTDKPRPGSVVCPVLTGSRCVLVELQALTATGFPGATKRKSSGLDPNRLAMLIAVLEQHGGVRLADRDVFASAVGGIRVVEPASDLALLLAIAGSQYKKPLSSATAVVGEVGLGGEVRPVAQLEQRIMEAARLGYKRMLVPAAQMKGIRAPKGMELDAIADVNQAIQRLG